MFVLPFSFRMRGTRPAVLLHVLLGQPDAEGDRRVPALEGEAELEVGVEGGRIVEEVGRPVLQPLVEGKDEQGPVGRTVTVEEPPQADPLSVADRKAVEGCGGRSR